MLRDESTRPGLREPKQRITEMLESVKSRAEEKFAATQKKDEQAQKEKENTWQQKMKHSTKLRALRLAKEAADKEDDG